MSRPGRGTRPVVVCWGELLWDLFPDAARLGGAAANVAFHAARLGAISVLVSRVGRDQLGARAVEELGRAGVDVSLVQVDDQHPTGTVRVAIEDGEPKFTLGERAAWDRIELGPELAERLARADALVYGTLAQRTPLGSAALAQALATVPAACHRVLDLNVRPPHVTRSVIEQALAGASAVKLNQHEAELLRETFGLADPLAWLLDERRLSVVALTRGSDGAVLGAGGSRHEHGGFAARAGGDPVGAGDAFTAVLALGLFRGTPLAELVRSANRYASFVASCQGAMPVPPGELVAGI